MADIFISYAREDKDLAELLAAKLAEEKWEVWYDIRVPAGSRFAEVIQQQLDNSTCVIVLWTRHSVKSRWVQEEADAALESGKLLPILIEKVRLPMGFRSIQAMNLMGWKGAATASLYKSLLNELTSRLGPSPASIERQELAEKERIAQERLEEQARLEQHRQAEKKQKRLEAERLQKRIDEDNRKQALQRAKEKERLEEQKARDRIAEQKRQTREKQKALSRERRARQRQAVAFFFREKGMAMLVIVLLLGSGVVVANNINWIRDTVSTALASPKEPGLYLTEPGKRGDAFRIENLEVVSGEGDGEYDRPTDFDRDLRGSCLSEDMQAGDMIEWQDVSISICE